MRIRDFLQRIETEYGVILSVSTSLTLIIAAMIIMKAVLSGRTSIISMIALCTTLIIASPEQMLFSTKYGWTKIIRQHGTVT